MKVLAIDLQGWQKRFGTEEACCEAWARQRWSEGICCPRCGHDCGFAISTRHRDERANCYYRALLTWGTLFHWTNLPLSKWFWAIYLMSSDKGGVSALRLAKQNSVSWIMAHRMLHKIRIAMDYQDTGYRLYDLVEIDDALVGDRKPGKRSRGAKGTMPVLVAAENRGAGAGFMAMQHGYLSHQGDGRRFREMPPTPQLSVRSDKLTSLREIGKTQHHAAGVASSDKGDIVARGACCYRQSEGLSAGNLSHGFIQTSCGISYEFC